LKEDLALYRRGSKKGAFNKEGGAITGKADSSTVERVSVAKRKRCLRGDLKGRILLRRVVKKVIGLNLRDGKKSFLF